MADNILVTPGTGATVAADDISGALHQRIKLTWGVDGSAVDASASNPLPVTSVVTTLPALVAGTAAIGKLAANSGVTIGAVELAASQTLSTVTSLSQFAGNAINLGAGAVGTGTLRITQASDSPLVAATGAIADVAWASGSGTIVSLLKTLATAALDTSTASPVNVTQIGSNLTATNNGVASTGCQRVVIASDNTAFSVNANVRTPCDVIAVTPTLDTSIYASGDTLFATTAISGAVRVNDERAVLMSIAVVDKDDQKPALRLLFFKANVTFGTANAAPSISDADAANYLGHVDIAAADYVDLGGVSVACAKAINLLLESASGTTTVYVAAMLTAGTPTHTASGLVFNFGVVQS